MRVGLSSIYSWRPHVEHLYYLATLLQSAGAETFFLTCDSSLPACYTRELRDKYPSWQECLMCRLGGLGSFTSANLSGMGSYKGLQVAAPEDSLQWCYSSASTLGRFESGEDYSSPLFQGLADRLHPSVDLAYSAALSWMTEKRLEAVLVFNGRIDATRAIIEAARKLQIPFASIERTWFGDGLQILPQEDCLGLMSVNKLVEEWADKPLTTLQACRAAKHIASRFTQSNNTEWRTYNTNSIRRPWPELGGRYKILLLPGSINEIWGHPDWRSEWDQPTDAYDAIIEHFSLSPSDIVLRCHPNWSENIGKQYGHKSEEYYASWANKRGVNCIRSSDTTSTTGLIEVSDAVVIASGSSALEAGALGKQVIGTAPANYQNAKIRDDACNPRALKKLRLLASLPNHIQKDVAFRIRRQTLRFAYTVTYRIPQYADFVKCLSTTDYVYRGGADGNKLLDLLLTGILASDDACYAESDQEERIYLALMQQKQWERLLSHPETIGSSYRPLSRAFPYSILSRIRSYMPLGDR
jgi:hypothetical protein